jgi:hypothetical protein
VPREARAFCGFYVSSANGELFNDATMVVLMREGTRTVLSMAIWDIACRLRLDGAMCGALAPYVAKSDPVRARALYRTACLDGDETSCRKLAPHELSF